MSIKRAIENNGAIAKPCRRRGNGYIRTAGMKHGGERVAVVGHTACQFRQTTQEEVQI